MDLVIFSSVFSILIVVAIALMYVAYGVISKLCGEKNIILTILAIVNLAAHLGLFVMCVTMSATIQELLFWLTVSAAFAITVTKHGKEEQ